MWMVWVLVASVGMLSGSEARGDAIAIAESGQARATIVLAENATAPQRRAAEELAAFLGQVTGAKFAIAARPDRARSSLLIGAKTARLVDPAFSVDDLGQDGIVLRTVGRDIILAGGEPRGTLYAVYTFLEDHVGCRWWTPTASTIPHRPTLKVGILDVRYVPVLEYRDTDAFGARDGAWSARNKLNGYFQQLRADQGGKCVFEPGFCHTFYTLISTGRYFEKHPEWFSLIRGKRTTTAPAYPQASLCLTNLAMRRELVANLKGLCRMPLRKPRLPA